MADLEKLKQEIGQLAQRHGIKMIVVALREPVSGKATWIATQGAPENLKAYLAEKLGFQDGPDESETGWS